MTGVPHPIPYTLVRLANGSCTVRSLDYAETFHPVVGPVREAESLYVQQLRLPQRLEKHWQAADGGPFVLWDVGLGAAANVLTALHALRHIEGRVRVLSFDQTLEALSFAVAHAAELGYFHGLEPHARALLQQHQCHFEHGRLQVLWTLHWGDFPTLVRQPAASQWVKPHAIFYDAYSPAANPEMWTLPLLTRICQLLDPQRPCALPTYSRSTMLRVSLLLAGFFVGTGHATGDKEETTIAANSAELIEHPLAHEWLKRVRRSTSAQPMATPIYQQSRLSTALWDQLQAHPQFQCGLPLSPQG